MLAGIGRRLPKRILDVSVALLLLALLSPVLLLVLAAMAIDMALLGRDRGSFLYSEPRISRGRVFDLLKLRTLTNAALDEMRRRETHARILEADPSNLTWAGRRILKPWYLDEVPQLLNVLRGELSLVGPRPWPPEMVARQVAEGHDYRNRVSAGLTGPAQVTKGSGSIFQELDVEYVRRTEQLGPLALVGHDLAILGRTVRVILRGEGLNY
jgi:lipopolysaccharide/colanic/teichoic acid biosynthesis glycosyltransferase